MRIDGFGIGAACLSLPQEPQRDTPARIEALADGVRQALGARLTDLVPGWNTLTVHYDPFALTLAQLRECLAPVLQAWQQQGARVAERASALHVVPVWYAGPDLAAVAKACGMGEDEVVALHSGQEFLVGAIGFAPGQAYLGPLDARLALPRRRTPRVRLPAGSVAIAERQSTIYPQVSPGGWHVLGYTAWRPFDARRDPPCLIAAGDHVRFEAVDEAFYRAAGGQA
ncbi:allophanate hydrolase subunit 1 [Verticiella sediminum]|uniref:Allophanate hydrolase subunit 1 n=1 Tax=Verticiella sediminum TaxID=1247510 RepID=A0A556AUS7_9BURK|nr:allophanate hydrolase subunit 1 [Verticiella sediminum]TSH96650.1 allophanate hydrolase subunit 1 [Verticiella sediminum]